MPDTARKSLPRQLIAPHAGYVYSGRVAAAAFATLRGRAQTIERVVLVGPAHYLPMRGIALPTVDAFETPLGQVPVDAQRWPKLPICHLSFGATHRTRPSTRSKSNCRSCRCCCRRSRLLPLVVGDAAAQIRRRSAAYSMGRAGDADRGQFRPVALPRLRDGSASGCGDRCAPSSAAIG